jgi:DNA-binding HxlR family transcriptional regulator
MKAKPSGARRSDCPINVILEMIGDSWSLLIVRDLMFEDRRTFQDFRDAEEKIATNILTNRLLRLEAAGIIEKRRDPGDARRYIYRLTERGIALAPILVEMILWAAKYNKTAAPVATLRRMTGNRNAFIADIRRRWKASRT